MRKVSKLQALHEQEAELKNAIRALQAKFVHFPRSFKSWEKGELTRLKRKLQILEKRIARRARWEMRAATREFAKIRTLQ